MLEEPREEDYTPPGSDRAQINHGGGSADNPVVSGLPLRLRIAKHNASETLRKAWVVYDGAVFKVITERAVDGDYEITIDITAGTHLSAGDPARLNVIHVTTSEHRHARVFVYCATQPAMITLDGYDASDWQKPLIYPLYPEV